MANILRISSNLTAGDNYVTVVVEGRSIICANNLAFGTVTFSAITEKDCVKERHPTQK